MFYEVQFNLITPPNTIYNTREGVHQHDHHDPVPLPSGHGEEHHHLSLDYLTKYFD